MIAEHSAQIATHTGLPAAVVEDLGAVPSYYLRYFYAHDAVVAEERGVLLSFDTDAPSLTQMSGDPSLMFEAISNLVDNAIKFSPAGGCVGGSPGAGWSCAREASGAHT